MGEISRDCRHDPDRKSGSRFWKVPDPSRSGAQKSSKIEIKNQGESWLFLGLSWLFVSKLEEIGTKALGKVEDNPQVLSLKSGRVGISQFFSTLGSKSGIVRIVLEFSQFLSKIFGMGWDWPSQPDSDPSWPDFCWYFIPLEIFRPWLVSDKDSSICDLFFSLTATTEIVTILTWMQLRLFIERSSIGHDQRFKQLLSIRKAGRGSTHYIKMRDVEIWWTYLW